jgi:putative redox protein
MAGEIHVRHEGGDRYRIEIAGHEIVVDQPVSAGGTDTGPTPTDLFVGTIAACTAHYAGRFLARHAVDPTGLEVDAAFRVGDRPARVTDVELRLVVPALPEALEDRFRAVVEHCTVKNSIVTAPEVDLRIARQVASAVADTN